LLLSALSMLLSPGAYSGTADAAAKGAITRGPYEVRGTADPLRGQEFYEDARREKTTRSESQPSGGKRREHL
jgi:hypothetical protein